MTPEVKATLLESLLRQCREKVEISYLRARENGVEEPAVLLLDLSDPIARSIASASGEPARLRTLLDAHEPGETRPMVTWGVSHGRARALIDSLSPEALDHFDALDLGDGFVVIAVAVKVLSIFVLSRP